MILPLQILYNMIINLTEMKHHNKAFGGAAGAVWAAARIGAGEEQWKEQGNYSVKCLLYFDDSNKQVHYPNG
jgi:hypothetical protein